MPIVFIHAEMPKESATISHLIENVRSAGASALGCDPSNIWVVFQKITSGFALRETADHFQPVVQILANRGRTLPAKEQFAQAIGQAVSDTLMVPINDLWLHYQEMNPEDIWNKDRWNI
jgi:phenylpyruvate tautomerase PptA (4-oxalocrotonate tautomerase family)